MGPPGPGGGGARTTQHLTGLEPTTCQRLPHPGHLHSHEGGAPYLCVYVADNTWAYWVLHLNTGYIASLNLIAMLRERHSYLGVEKGIRSPKRLSNGPKVT